MNIKKLIQIDNRFEKSVNLSLDLHDPQKLANYIPTKSSLKLIKEYFNSTISQADSRARLLIGPYGKGKSHLLLVILCFLAKYNVTELKELKYKMIAVMPEISAVLSEVEEKGPFLPVIINPSEGNLHQAFYKGIMKALREADMSDVVPDSYYSEAIRTIKAWKQEYPDTFVSFCNTVGNSYDGFINRLEKYDEAALEEFKAVYPTLTSGAAFNPLIDDDIVSVYRSINRELYVKKGYSGIFIVFDEFSKYIEGHGEYGFAADMKTLQDICELASSSKEEQLHITCIAHKSINAYNKTIKPEFANAFEGVSGRLTEVNFVVSSKNNYELIADAIKKKNEFEQFIESDTHFNHVSEKSYRLSVFSSLFTETDYRKIVAEGCYPLTPVSAMILLELSEKVAQNERTVFTYLTGKERYSLIQTISRSHEATFADIGSVYDYFAPLFKKEDSNIHHEWLKAEYALGNVTSENEENAIKAIALIRMIGKDELRADDEVLSAALGFDDKTYKETVNALRDEGLIVYKKRSKSYEFKNNIGVDLEDAISDVIGKHFVKIDVAEALGRICKEKYILPKKHNHEYRITRYFNVNFTTYDQLMALQDISYLETSFNPDGFVLFLLPRPEAIKQEDIKKCLKNLDMGNIAIIPPVSNENIAGKVQKLLAAEWLLKSAEFTENSPVLIKELSDLCEDLSFDINEWIHTNYYTSKEYYCREGRKQIPPEGINRVVSDLCDATYFRSPIINNELINRQNVSAQIAKARNNIIDMILSDGDVSVYEKGTSAEATIYRAVFSRASSKEAWNEVEKEFSTFFTGCVGKKNCFSHLINKLTTAPYGMRRGVLPIVLSHEIAKRHGTPVIYLNDKELILNEEALINAVKRPSDYYLFIEEASAAKDKYIAELCSLFEEYSIYCKDIDNKNKLSKTVCLMQTWYRSLPQASITFKTPDSPDEDFEKLIAFRSIFSSYFLNPRDVLFDKIPEVFATRDYDELIGLVKKAKVVFNRHISLLKDAVNDSIRKTLDIPTDANLHEALIEWYSSLPKETQASIFSGVAGNLSNLFKDEIPSDKELIASRFAKAVTGLFIEDWAESTLEQFSQTLSEAIVEISNKHVSVKASRKLTFITEDGQEKNCLIDFDPDELSVSGTFLQNALLDAMDEFGDVIDDREKLGILMDIASSLIK